LPFRFNFLIEECSTPDRKHSLSKDVFWEIVLKSMRDKNASLGLWERIGVKELKLPEVALNGFCGMEAAKGLRFTSIT
jgi:hypothetical protein